VAAIDLRTTPKYHYPDAPQDVNYAVRWLKAHAADFNADAATLGAFGGSSGGHLVELTAMRPRDSRYTEPVPGLGDDASLVYLFTRAPISDPFARFEWAVERGRHDIDEHTHAFFQPWEEIFDANPQRILERGEAAPLPPLLIVQGSEDDNIPPSIQTHFAETYRAAGGYVEYEEFPGAPHQFLNQPGADSEHALRLAREFIARQLKTLQPVGG
jgi:acetyl esterase/lipase